MKVLNFQDKAVKKLIEYSEELLSEQIPLPTIIFESPTGSGKTFMVSQYIKQMSELPFDISYIWVAPQKLHSQSKRCIGTSIKIVTRKPLPGAAEII